MSGVTARPASTDNGHPGFSASRNKSGASYLVICSEASADKAARNRADRRSADRAAGNNATCDDATGNDASGSAEVFCRTDSSATNGVN